MVTVDPELSPAAQSLLNNLRSRGGAIRGNITTDQVMWLYWRARPGETVAASTFKELLKRGLIEFQANLTKGEKRYHLSELGQGSKTNRGYHPAALPDGFLRQLPVTWRSQSGNPRSPGDE